MSDTLKVIIACILWVFIILFFKNSPRARKILKMVCFWGIIKTIISRKKNKDSWF